VDREGGNSGAFAVPETAERNLRIQAHEVDTGIASEGSGDPWMARLRCLEQCYCSVTGNVSLVRDRRYSARNGPGIHTNVECRLPVVPRKTPSNVVWIAVEPSTCPRVEHRTVQAAVVGQGLRQ
jgi:hypothetical protein